jgi:hypothetical protein
MNYLKQWHEGRFRFGKRDGQGIFKDIMGNITRGVFRDADCYYLDKNPPVIDETYSGSNLFQPPSLLRYVGSPS